MIRPPFRADPGPVGVITAIRSRRDLYYLAAYRRHGSGAEQSVENALCEVMPEWVLTPDVKGWPLIGGTPQWWDGEAAIVRQVDADVLLDVAEGMWRRG